jgi:hypothetical protein
MGGGRWPGVGRASVVVGVGQMSAGRASEHRRLHSGRGVERASASQSEHWRPHNGRVSTGRATPCDNRAEGGSHVLNGAASSGCTEEIEYGD